MARYVVGLVEDIPPGTKKILEIAGRSIGVYNVGGEFFALLNRCPHQAGPLCAGHAQGQLKPAGVGVYDYSRPGEMVRCPWHAWEFDLRTGQSWFDPDRFRVRSYDVVVAPGSELETPPPANPGTTPAELAATTPPDAPRDDSGLVKGPYVAETFPVSVERQYVLVEI
ncbi:MAG: Rieske (2Fe-2S) protein [Chloroflexota bacterium]